MRIGLINYLNALPLHLFLDKTKHSFYFDIPTKLNEALLAGKTEASLVSSTIAPQGFDFCIAAKHEIMSVNLYVKESVRNLNEVSIALTSESSASCELLKVIAHHFWRVSPQWTSLSKPYETYEAFLLIGDEALKKRAIKGYRTIDLALQWYYATHLPFVFALFSYRNYSKSLSQDIERALSQAENNFEKVIACAYEISGIERDILRKYYSLITYRLGEKEREGLKLFHKLRTTCTPEMSLKA